MSEQSRTSASRQESPIVPPVGEDAAARATSGSPMAMLNALPAHIALLDADGAIVAVNEAWRRFGAANVLQSRDFLVGQNYIEVCERADGACSDEATDVAQGIRRVLSAELEEFRLEYPCHSPHEERWFLLMVTPLYWADQHGAVVMHVDITGRKQDESAIRRAEQTARESEQRLGFALHAAEIGDWDMNLRTNVARRSLRHDQCFGYSEPLAEWGYETFLAHVHVDDRGRVDDAFKSSMAGGGEYDVEFRTVWQDGSLHWLWSKGRFYFDDGNAPYRVAGIVVDITTRKHAERQLRRHKASLVASQRIAHLGSWELDLVNLDDLSEGALRWSDEVFRIWGREPQSIEVSYDNFLAAVHPDDRGLIADAVSNALAEHRPYDLVHRIVRPDGTERTVREQAEFQFDLNSGEAVRMIGTVLDITEQRETEQALRRALDRLHNAQRLGEIGDWEWDVVTQEISWSPQLFEIMKRNPADGPPRDYAELEILFDKPSREVQQQHVSRALATGEAQRYELTVVHPDGGRVDVEVYAVPELDAAGQVRRLRGTLQDLSSRKRAEAVLAASEQRLDLATQSAGIGIWDWNIADDTMVWDARMYELYGIGEHDFASTFEATQRCVHPDDWKQVSSTYADFSEGRTSYALTFRIVRPSGEVRYIEAHAMLQRSADGTPLRMIGVNWDITTRKREEAALTQLAGIVASSDDAIIGKDLDSTVTSWNRGAEKVFGYSASETVGTSILRLIPDDRRHEESSIVARVQKGESVEHFETLRRTKSGRFIEVSVTASPIRDALGAIVGISTVSRDISERKKLERQFYRAQRLESIGTLAGGIAHDLNNALSPIILSLDLLNASFPDHESQELLRVIGASADHAADMVRQVLSFARGVEGKRLEVDMRVLIGDIEKISRDTFLKHIVISARTAPDLHPVLGDRTQLQQVLVNLCVNARDAMPDGGQLTITAENVHIDARHDETGNNVAAGEYICVRVEDSGEGMSSDVIERIFDPFFTTKEVGKGTGLGLSTSLTIIESHGGVIRVYSERGRGTTFTVYLPANGEASAVAAVSPSSLPRGNGELVLVVDDEPAVRTISKQILESFGYRCMVAVDGASGLAMCDAHREEIAVVLTDMMMPVMDGPTMIRQLRARWPEVRVVGTSGLSAHDQFDESTGHGLRHFLAKPFTADALLRTLEAALVDAR